MTTAPRYPLAHSYGDGHSGENPFELIESRWGVLERWRATALETGSLGGLSVIADQVRADAAETLGAVAEREAIVTEREQCCDARERTLADMARQVAAAADRAIAEWGRIEQARADQEREPEPEPPSGLNKFPEPLLPVGDDLHANDPQHADLPPPRDPGQQDSGSLPEPPNLSPIDPEFPSGAPPDPPPQRQPVAAGLDRH